jgi:hypothetical protein
MATTPRFRSGLLISTSERSAFLFGADPSHSRSIILLIGSRRDKSGQAVVEEWVDQTRKSTTTAAIAVAQTRRLDISTLSDEQLDALEETLRVTLPQLAASGGG